MEEMAVLNYDLSIALGIIRMRGFYRYFSRTVFRLKNMGQQKDLFIFRCTLMIFLSFISLRFELNYMIV